MTGQTGPETYTVRLRAGNPFRPTAYVAIAPEIDPTDPAATIYGVHLGTHHPDAEAAVPEALVPRPTVATWAALHVHTATAAARLDRNMLGGQLLASLGAARLTPVRGPVALTTAHGGPLADDVVSAVVAALHTARCAEDDRRTAAAEADPATVAAGRTWLAGRAAAGQVPNLTPREVADLPAARVIHALDLRYASGLYGFLQDHPTDPAAL
ncbi:hypothetical protein ACFROC_22925 [Nocardia tengchongensis]|uniref:hypothetical protein n=1 Tax=Nocardia tengchongensis TaxID=2055889 RepID=UPI0036760AB6